MSDKVGGMLFALVFAVCFGGVGVFAASAMGAAVWEGLEAENWIRVRANVVKYDGSGLQYRYRVGERDYAGEKIGVGWLQNSEIDAEVDARLTAAMSTEKPVTVFVNPADPTKSVVDPQIPWMMLAFMTPFAFGFGGVGLGAAYVLLRILTGADEKKKAAARRGAPAPVKSSAAGEVAAIWIFAFFWNVISFPIALVAVPDLVRNGEWLGLLVLIFPGIGVLLLWGAISATIRMLRRGPARLVVSTSEPRMGLPLSGHVEFSRGVKAGDHFRARLGAYFKGGGDSSPTSAWHKEVNVQVVQGPDGERANFRFDVPSRLKTSLLDPEDYGDLSWRLELHLPGQPNNAVYGFDLELEPAPDLGTADALVDDAAETPLPAGLPAEFQGLAALVGKEKIDSLSARDRAKFHEMARQLSPDQREQVAKLVKAGPLIKKLVIVAIVLFVVVQVAGVIVALGFSS
jgi:hypothetical protein